MEQYAEVGGKTFAVEVSGQIAGLMFFCNYTQRDKRIELGYWLGKGYEGRGLVTRGCRALLRHCFETLDMNRVDITSGVGNARSRAVAERLGMTLEGVSKQWRLFPDGRYVDVARYRLLREDWHLEAEQ